jgi:peptidoglycan hydrolase CwlO-like protein
MIQLYFQLIQSVTGAVVTIIGLLLVASVIGYFTAWYYSKSIYTPVIKGLEADKETLKKEVASLKDDIVKLNGSIDRLNDKIAVLAKDLAAKEKEMKELTKASK